MTEEDAHCTTACRVWRQNGPQANSGALFLACVTFTWCMRHDSDHCPDENMLLVSAPPRKKTRARTTTSLMTGTTSDGTFPSTILLLHIVSPSDVDSLSFRDELVAEAMGTKSHKGVIYNTVAQNITGVMPTGSDGVNHGRSILPLWGR